MDLINSKDISLVDSLVSEDKFDLPDHEKPLIPILQPKPTEKNLIINELNQVSEMMTEVNLANKEMFQVISEKLSRINESLNFRQRELISMLSNSPDQDEISLKIQKVKNPDFKLRTKSDFEKLMDQFFAGCDQSLDFKLFSQDIDGIRMCLDQSNTVIDLIREENEKERKFIDKRISLIESELSDIKLKKIQPISNFQEYITRHYFGILENLPPQLLEMKQQQSKNNGLINEMDSKIRILKSGVENQKLQNLCQSENFLIFKETCSKSIEEVMSNAQELANKHKNDVKLILNRQESLVNDLMVAQQRLKSEFEQKLNTLKKGLTNCPNILDSLIDEKLRDVNEKISDLTETVTSNYREFKIKGLDDFGLNEKTDILSSLSLENFHFFEHSDIEEIIKSDDDRFVFICNFYLGN